MKTTVPAVVAAAALGLLVGFACSSPPSPPPPSQAPSPTELPPATHTIEGTFILEDYDVFSARGDKCSGAGGTDDLREGTQVVVYDLQNSVLATSSLGQGRRAGDTRYLPCVFPFSVEVPDAPFYQIEVSYRGRMVVAKEDLEAASWKVIMILD